MIEKIKDAEINVIDGKHILSITYIMQCGENKYDLIIPGIVLNDINFNRIMPEEETNWSFDAIPSKDKNGDLYYFELKLNERSVSKSELEGELGYKLNIID